MNLEPQSFSDLNLRKELLQALTDLNFNTPSPIQGQTIPFLLQQRDLIGQAQTGTGKTAAFALPILQNLDLVQKEPQALILTPTRELAIQIAEHFKALSKYQTKTKIAILCGGQAYRPQIQDLKNGAQIIVGTPGRVLDHMDRGTLILKKLKTFVLDEADEMLRMGFIEDVESVLEQLPDSKQLALFSATMPSRIRTIANRFLKNPALVEIKSSTATVKSVDQKFIFASPKEKPDALLRILATEDYQGVIVFVRTKTGAEEVAAFVQKENYRAVAIHGDITQSVREKIITQFRKGTIDILIATDVAARGLDVERVTHVINYDMVGDCETYVHRIGRTGRAGRNGTTILFVTPKEGRMLNMIERHTRQKILKISLPNDAAINLAKQKKLFAKINSRLQAPLLASYRKLLQNYINDHTVDTLDVASALALLLNKDKPLQYESLLQNGFKKDKNDHIKRNIFSEQRDKIFQRKNRKESTRYVSKKRR